MIPYYQDSHITLYHGDCREIVPTLGRFDLLLTDPPYPNFFKKEYGYCDNILDFAKELNCRQLIFWSNKDEFPLNFTATHIWNKLCGTYSIKEKIYERNGEEKSFEFKYQKIKNKIDAQMNRDVITGHPSQKPIRLISNLISLFSKTEDIICDTFAGSGTTGKAAKDSGRKCIMIEREERYCEIAAKRMAQEVLF